MTRTLLVAEPRSEGKVREETGEAEILKTHLRTFAISHLASDRERRRRTESGKRKKKKKGSAQKGNSARRLTLPERLTTTGAVQGRYERQAQRERKGRRERERKRKKKTTRTARNRAPGKPRRADDVQGEDKIPRERRSE